MHTLLERPAAWNDQSLATDYHFPYTVSGIPVGYRDIFETFAESPEGRHQAGQELRFHKDYPYPSALMRHDLGPDVDPLDHGWYLYLLTTRFFAAELQDEQESGRHNEHLPRGPEIALLRLQKLTHDYGENEYPEIARLAGGSIGDVPYGKKTPEQKQTEANVRQVLYGRHCSMILPHFIQRMEALTSHTEQSHTHAVGELLHDTGAHLTVMTAAKLALQGLGQDDQRWHTLRGMAVDISPRTQAALEPWSDKFRFIGNILLETEDTFLRTQKLLR